MANVMWVILGLVVGGGVAWLVAQAASAKNSERLRSAEAVAANLSNELRVERATGLQLRAEAERAKATLESERKAFEEQKALLADAEKKFKESFAALAADALQRNNADFLHLAKTKLEAQQSDATKDLEIKRQAVESLVSPLSETLRQLQQQVAEVSGGQKDLKTETSRLVTALRTPIHRGRWGEVQLKRVVELAGMVAHCDFHEQLSFTTDEGTKQRPDMTIHLPGGHEIAVDSKVPFEAFYDATETQDETQRMAKLKQHASLVRAHVSHLSSKSYWQQLPSTPELVVAFLPGESFLSAALQFDPSLLEYGADQRVILATPTTLIALLKAAYYGWKQVKLTEHALEVQEIGRQLYERLSRFVERLDKTRERIDQTVKAFDDSVASLNNLIHPVNKFRELGAARGDEILGLETIERSPREVPELKAPTPQLRLKKLAAVAGDDVDE